MKYVIKIPIIALILARLKTYSIQHVNPAINAITDVFQVEGKCK